MQKILVPAILTSLIFTRNCNSQSAGKEFDKIFNSYIDSGFSGVAIVEKNDTIILHKAYGYANDEKKIPNTVQTLFSVASIGKQFTAAIVLMLAEKRLLNIKDHVSQYVGKLGGLKDSATIEHLLMHSSGLFVEGIQLDYSSREKYIESIRNTPLESKPGEKYRYSNAGYTLLAAVVEIVTNQPFEDVLYKMIFQPAGMSYTGFPWEPRIRNDLLATGYNSKGEMQPVQENIWGARGPGDLVTSTEDMLKWYHSAWIGNTIISQNIKDQMLNDRIPGKETFSWNKATIAGGKKLYFKGGGRPDFESQVMWLPDDKLFIFFSINRDRNIRRLIYRDIISYLNKPGK